MGKPRSKVNRPTDASNREASQGESNRSDGERLPTGLNMVSRPSVSEMEPGDFVFLDDFVYLRGSFPSNSIAIMACPLCGTAGLITVSQFSGATAIVCGSRLCSGHFRIAEEAQIVYLPPS